MATINLSVGSGETKTITFQSAGTYNTEDIVFSVSGSGGDTNTTLSGFAYSNTAAGTAAKTATMPGFALSSGQRIVLYLATSSTVANATLNINSAGAKAVRIGGAATTASNFTSGYWICAYDGTYWNAEKIYLTDNNTTYNFSGTSFTSTNSTASDKNANNLTSNGTYYYASNGPSTDLGASTADGALYVQAYSTSWVGQIAQDYRNGRLFVRGKNNGTWQAWKRVANYDEVATSGHNHDSVYKKKQTAVTDPPISIDTAGAFVDSITQNEQGVITATKKSLPLASSSAAGITKVGASGGAAAYSHSHGNVTSGGALQTTDITIANGDKLVVTDASDSNKVARTSIAFDGSTTTQVLSKKGTWVSLPSDTDSKVSQKLEESTSDLWRPILLGFDSKREFGNFDDSITNHAFIHNKIGFNIKSSYIRANGFVSDGSSGFLLANGGVDNSSYALSNHTHSGYASSSHTHGSITNGGAITSDTAIANGDHLVITDASDSNKIKRTSITFGTSTSTYLRNDGTWGTPSGGSGGGSTVSANNITLSTSAQTYITVNGSNKTIQLPDTCPWEVTASIASPLFEHDVIGSVTPIAATRNLVVVKGEYKGLYDTTPTLIFPNIGESCMALPIFMDKRGRLFLIISDEFASNLLDKYGYSTNPAGKGK